VQGLPAEHAVALAYTAAFARVTDARQQRRAWALCDALAPLLSSEQVIGRLPPKALGQLAQVLHSRRAASVRGRPALVAQLCTRLAASRDPVPVPGLLAAVLLHRAAPAATRRSAADAASATPAEARLLLPLVEAVTLRAGELGAVATVDLITALLTVCGDHAEGTPSLGQLFEPSPADAAAGASNPCSGLVLALSSELSTRRLAGLTDSRLREAAWVAAKVASAGTSVLPAAAEAASSILQAAAAVSKQRCRVRDRSADAAARSGSRADSGARTAATAPVSGFLPYAVLQAAEAAALASRGDVGAAAPAASLVPAALRHAQAFLVEHASDARGLHPATLIRIWHAYVTLVQSAAGASGALRDATARVGAAAAQALAQRGAAADRDVAASAAMARYRAELAACVAWQQAQGGSAAIDESARALAQLLAGTSDGAGSRTGGDARAASSVGDDTVQRAAAASVRARMTM
jgi:hypothetical protein